MIDIWQLHSKLGIAVEIPHLILGVLKDKAMLSVKPQTIRGMRRERKNPEPSLCPLGGPLIWGVISPACTGGSWFVALVCAQSVIFTLFFVFLTRSAVSTFWIANPHNNLINCAAAGSEVSAEVSCLVIIQTGYSPARLRLLLEENLLLSHRHFGTARWRRMLMPLVPQIEK